MDMPASITKDEAFKMLLNKSSDINNPIYTKPPNLIKDKSSLSCYMMLLKNGSLGVRGGYDKDKYPEYKSDSELEYYEIEQSDESNVCYTFMKTDRGYVLIDRCVMKPESGMVIYLYLKNAKITYIGDENNIIREITIK